MRTAEGYDDTVRVLRDQFKKDCLTINDLAAYFGLTSRTIANLAKQGDIPMTKVGAHWRMSIAQLARFETNKR